MFSYYYGLKMSNGIEDEPDAVFSIIQPEELSGGLSFSDYCFQPVLTGLNGLRVPQLRTYEIMLISEHYS